MSFILDALERARRDRAALPTDPVLPDAPDSGQPHRRSSLSAWLAIALVLALTALAWLWFTPPPVPNVDHPSDASALLPPQHFLQAGSDRFASPALAATAPPEGAEWGGQSERAAIAELYAASRSKAAGDASPAREPMPANVPGPEVSKEGSAQSAAPAQAPQVMVDTLVARAEAALDNRGLAAHPAPMLDELSKALRDEIPTLMYSQHDYHAESSESSVYINRERRREGDSIAGVRVQQILPDSVILRYGDTVFRLRALNSWVNL